MKIAVMSDLHIEFERRRQIERGGPAALTTDGRGHPSAGPSLDALAGVADILVLAGDVDLGGHAFSYAEAAAGYLGIPAVMIAGNHEFYGLNDGGRRMDRLVPALRERSRNGGGRVHFLERDAAVVGGVRFLGCVLWTDLELYGRENAAAAEKLAGAAVNDFRQIEYREGALLTPALARDEFRRGVEFLVGELEKPFDGPTVIVTHHAPSYRSVAGRFRDSLISAAFASNLDALVEGCGAPVWIHGHTHISFDYAIGRTRVLCNPRGYWPDELNPRFDPALVVEV